MTNNEIKFYPYFFNSLIEGIKTSTLRKEFDLKVGDTFEVRDLDKTCEFVITKINRIRFDEINDKIARKEGYSHKDIFKEEIRRIYKNVNENSLFYQVEFLRKDLIKQKQKRTRK